MNQYSNHCQVADVGGCGFYRVLSPYWTVRNLLKDSMFSESIKPIVDANYFRGVSHVMVQRPVMELQHKYFTKFLQPLSEKYGFWLTLNIDDITSCIPSYNSASLLYDKKETQDKIRDMCNVTDFLIVTTEYLKQCYHEDYGIPLENIIVIKNYIARWWLGEAYRLEEKVQQYNEFKKRPRIGIISSASHFDHKNKNDGVDDFTHINDFIRSTCGKYEWCFYLRVPKQLEDLARDRKITVYPGSDILNYLRELNDKKFQMIVAPLMDNRFNRCKSNIKQIESWGLGIPAICQNLPMYADHSDLVFNDANDLQNQIDRVLQSENKYRKIVRDNRHIVDYGDSKAPTGYWLEKNIAPWYKLFTLPQKKIGIPISQLMGQSAEKKQQFSIAFDNKV